MLMETHYLHLDGSEMIACKLTFLKNTSPPEDCSCDTVHLILEHGCVIISDIDHYVIRKSLDSIFNILLQFIQKFRCARMILLSRWHRMCEGDGEKDCEICMYVYIYMYVGNNEIILTYYFYCELPYYFWFINNIFLICLITFCCTDLFSLFSSKILFDKDTPVSTSI